MPAPEIDERARTRGQAFGSLADEIAEILARFDQIGEGVIPATPSQFLGVMRETEILTRVAELARSADRLNGLDLADRKVVGGPARAALAPLPALCEELLSECEDVGRFRPQPAATELRELALSSGRYGVEIAGAAVGVVAAQTFDDAREHGKRLKGFLDDGFPLADAYTEALENLEAHIGPDLNERVSLALGLEGHFLDEDGGLDMTRMLVGFAGEEEPLAALGERTFSYFSYLLDGKPPADAPGAILMPALALINGSERPLRSHSIALALRERLSEAMDADPEATEALIESTTTQGALIYSALSRVERVFEDFDEDDDPEQLIDNVMRVYKDIVETSFRTMGWLAIRLDRIIAGEQDPGAKHPPMLRELCDQLSTGGRLSRLLADGVDVGLRNAEAHSQYQWIADREVIRDLREETEWTVEELADALTVLVSCLAGVDAGYGCFIVGAGLPGGLPEWLADGGFPVALQMLATICFAPYGHEIERTEDRGGTIILKKVGSRDPSRLIPPLGGIAGFSETDTYRVRTTAGEELISVPAAEVREAIAVVPAFKDLAILELTHRNARQLSDDPTRVDDEFAAFVAKVIGAAGMQALAESELAPTALSDLRARSQRSIAFLGTLNCGEVDIRDLKKRLARVRDAAPRAGREGGIASLVALLGNLVELAEATGYRWPPKASR